MNRCQQTGFSLVAAIFLLVILSAMGVFMLQISGTQATTTALTIQGSRAYFAARSGLEYAVFQAVNGSCTNQTINFNEGVLADYSADLTCSSSSYTEFGSTVNVYSVTARAYSGSYGNAYYVSRTVEARFTD